MGKRKRRSRLKGKKKYQKPKLRDLKLTTLHPTSEVGVVCASISCGGCGGSCMT